MPWYFGGVHFIDAGRFTHSWTPWNRPPLAIMSCGGSSECMTPDPAVIHCVAPSVMIPPPPVESMCSNWPSIM